MQRIFSIAILTALIALGANPSRLAAANPAGDADNDGSVTLADAALVQAVVVGSEPAAAVSPLALTGGDTALGIDDLLFAGQAAGAVRSGLTPPPGMLNISVPPVPLEVASEQTPNPVISFAVVSAYPGAGEVNGLEIGSFAILESVESTLVNPDATVQTNIANVELVPLNTGATDDSITVRLTVPLNDSEGNPLAPLTGDFPVTVHPAACGDGTVQSGEVCDDGDTDPCTPACDASCAGPGIDAICGNGVVECSETCDFVDDFSIVGSCNAVSQFYSIAIQGDRAYLYDGDAMYPPTAALRIIDIGNPTYPIIGSSDLGTPDWINSVAVKGDYAYVTTGSGLKVVDISTTAYPIIGSVNAGGNGQDIVIDQMYAYIAVGPGIQIIDIGMPASPMIGDFCATSGGAEGIAVLGNRAYVADGGSGLQVLDLSSPGCPVIASRDTPGNALGIAVSGDRAFIADGFSGLQVIDISDPGYPIIGSQNLPGNAYGVTVSGSRAFIAVWSGLQVVDIGDPTYPIIGYRDTPNGAHDVAVTGDRAYLVRYYDIQVIDITESCGPQCSMPACGDGALNPGETCDDGNFDDCDGCQGNCLSLNAICGNGLLECDEACDDGDTTNATPGCDRQCAGPFLPGCGNGSIETGEACDDGNTQDCDGCQGDCSRLDHVCGDGIVECSEVCDDGNTTSCDGCMGDCAYTDCNQDGIDCTVSTCQPGQPVTMLACGAFEVADPTLCPQVSFRLCIREQCDPGYGGCCDPVQDIGCNGDYYRDDQLCDPPDWICDWGTIGADPDSGCEYRGP